MIVLLMGPPGAGKGTQADEIVQEFGIPHISTGDMFRSAAAEGTELGLKAKAIMETGKLVPDDVTIGIVKDRLMRDDCIPGCLFDGFPRTIAQAEALDSMLEEMGRRIDCVLSFEVPDEVLVERLTGRLVCRKCGETFHIRHQPPKVEGICDDCGGELYIRDDDKEETARNRLDVYHAQTAPLLSYYQQSGVIVAIDANCGIEEVGQQIMKALASLQ
jgi:adenylate kinases